MAKKRNEEFSEDEYPDEPNFDDSEDFVDDITDEELLGDLLSKKPCESDGMEACIVVDNVPKVAAGTRQEKLRTVIEKLFGAFGELNKKYFPVDEEGTTVGYAFLEYKTPANAEEAQRAMNNHFLDKGHKFQVNLFTDFQKYEHIPEKWVQPEPQPFKVQNDLYSFWTEPDAYDQYCVAAETAPNSIQVQFWQNTLPEPTDLETRERFTDTFVKWSPLGTYCVTFHKQGVALWGGPNFSKVNKFAQNGTQFVEFSPSEQYLVTYGPTANGQKIVIWDIRTGAEKRSFVTEGHSSNMSMLRWSHDDRFVAQMSDNAIHVYETPSFFLLDMKSIKVPGIRNFSWSPTENIIAYWVGEENDVPAKVTLMDIPRKQEIRNKILFNVADCKIHWQKSGDYLCVKVDRYSKSRKDKKDADVKFMGIFYNLEIFHMREKDIPTDSVEIKDQVIMAFAWEPIGHKFAIIHGEQNNSNVSFYEVKKGQKPALVKKLEKKVCTHLFWSPRGTFIVMANLTLGMFEFIDTENDYVMMGGGDHFRASEVEWDPTGRYVVTGVSAWKVKEDTGYYVWSFQGKITKRVMLKNFIQFLWRPRPPCLLGEQRRKEVKKSLKKYYAQFEKKDTMRMSRASKELLEKRSELRKVFQEYRVKRIAEYAEQKARRMELRSHFDTDDLDTNDMEEETIEFLTKEESTIV